MAAAAWSEPKALTAWRCSVHRRSSLPARTRCDTGGYHEGKIQAMKCQCPSSAHGHRPGHCASEATIDNYCPRCKTEKAKEDALKPVASHVAATPSRRPSGKTP